MAGGAVQAGEFALCGREAGVETFSFALPAVVAGFLETFGQVPDDLLEAGALAGIDRSMGSGCRLNRNDLEKCRGTARQSLVTKSYGWNLGERGIRACRGCGMPWFLAICRERHGRVGFVAYLRGAVTRWVDDAFPGWVETQLVEADGTVVVLTDKIPVFGLDDLTADTPLPAAVELACEVVRRERDRHDRELVVVVLSHGVMDQEGRNQFRVLADQIV